MPSRNIQVLFALPLAAALLVGCSESGSTTTGAAPSGSVAAKPTGSGSAKPAPSSSAAQVPTSKPAAGNCPIAPPPAADGKYAYDKSGVPLEAKRRLVAKFVKVSDDKKQLLFSVTNDTCSTVDKVEGRLFYFDDKGKCYSDAQVLSHDITLAPGETKELPFSATADALGKLKTAELENYNAMTKDYKRVWGNENLWLVKGAGCDERAAGGLSDDELKKHAGQPVLGYFVDKGTKKSKFSLKNLSDKPVKSVNVVVFIYDKDGKRVNNWGDFADVVIKPKETAEIEAGPELKDLPKDGVTTEITVTGVKYEDGSEFKNYTLGSSNRPQGG